MTILVESCFQIRPKLFKKDIQRARGKQIAHAGGYIDVIRGNTRLKWGYRLECGTDNDYLAIDSGEGEQKIKLAESELHFGPRTWFVCDCGRRVSKLYLPPQGTLFKCRSCHRLIYELSTINRKSRHGHLMYQTNRAIKLINTREGIRTIFYAGDYTNRFKHFLALCDKAGYTSAVEDAKGLLLALKS